MVSTRKLQVLAQRLDLVEEVDHVGLLQTRILQHQAEEIGQLPQRLVGDHHGALLYHGLLDLGRHFVQPVVEIPVALHLPQAGRHIPKADVGALRALKDQLESRTLPHLGGEELGHAEDLLDMRFQALAALGLPHKPELEDIRPATALDVLVARVIGGIVELVLLEQVCGIGRVALSQHLLVARKKGGALLGCRQQLVGIPCNRISAENEVKSITSRFRNSYRAN